MRRCLYRRHGHSASPERDSFVIDRDEEALRRRCGGRILWSLFHCYSHVWKILVVTPKGETLHQRLLSYKSMSRNYYYYMLNSTVCICARRMPRLRRRRSEAQKASITYCTEPSVQSPSLTERKLPLTGLASLFSIVRDCLRFV